MALQSSGAISLSDIQTEFGGSNPISLSEYYGSDTVPASGAISINDFYGTSNISYIVATGGTISTDGDYKIHSFTTSSSFNISAGVGDIEYLVVGAGGGSSQGGGGGGAVLSGTVLQVSTTQNITIGVGGQPGGIQAPYIQSTTDGGDSSVFGITANGGKKAAHSGNAPGGESGNGNLPGNIAYWIQSSGGGAGSAGYDTGIGGDGLPSNITGSTIYYGGGGSGSLWGGTMKPHNHAGAGGNGDAYNQPNGHTDGDGGGVYTVGAGGGAGGAWGSNGNGVCLNYCYGGFGGAGIVIIKYLFQ